MVVNSPFDDLKIKEAFGRILSTENFGNTINDIAEMIYKDTLDKGSYEVLLSNCDIKHSESIKSGILTLVLSYINFILEDKFITSDEAKNVHFLKRFFKVEEGDFFKYKYRQIELILDRQFGYMYQDNKIDTTEALQKVELQQLFDLSYDQFLKLSEKAVKTALKLGANPDELDTLINPDYLKGI